MKLKYNEKDFKTNSREQRRNICGDFQSGQFWRIDFTDKKRNFNAKLRYQSLLLLLLLLISFNN